LLAFSERLPFCLVTYNSSPAAVLICAAKAAPRAWLPKRTTRLMRNEGVLSHLLHLSGDHFHQVLCVTVDEAGFCRVTRRPSTTERACQLRTFSKMAPRRISSSSTRNGTTLVSCISSSSPFVKPLTRFPFTSGSPL